MFGTATAGLQNRGSTSELRGREGGAIARNRIELFALPRRRITGNASTAKVLLQACAPTCRLSSPNRGRGPDAANTPGLGSTAGGLLAEKWWGVRIGSPRASV